ncbi:hypothetical protein C0Q70_12858 [Pomacea canaliculata]|uniref:Ig-like domain-containing protein n=1 Tax=Pomacea canaliculata TaxID=400727 RepID=A0A2T7P2Q8_POMCA|nr:hypothetical protein C0Q70_12858 [Pomacea canaliculata]
MRTGSWIALPFVIVCFVQSIYSDSGQPNVLTTDCPKYVSEGNNLSCTCQTTDYIANTGDFSPYWKEQSDSAQLVKNDVSRHDNGTVFTCVMKWGEGKVTMNYTLLVAYGPEKVQISGPSTFITNGSQDITLTCSTTGSYPEASFYWGIMNMKCQPPNPTPTCIFRPRGRYDEGRNISCTAFNKETGTYSPLDIYTLRLHFEKRHPPLDLLMAVIIGCLTSVALIAKKVYKNIIDEGYTDESMTLHTTPTSALHVGVVCSGVVCDSSYLKSCSYLEAKYRSLGGSYLKTLVCQGTHPPELAPHITARRKVNSTTVDIVTCSVTGGHPQVSFVNLTCDDTRNSSLSDDSPETNQTDVVFTSIVFALVGPRTVSCTCQGVWSPQQDMYQHIVNASFYFSRVTLSDILEKECIVDNQINNDNVKKNKDSSSSDCLTPDTPK